MASFPRNYLGKGGHDRSWARSSNTGPIETKSGGYGQTVKRKRFLRRGAQLAHAVRIPVPAVERIADAPFSRALAVFVSPRCSPSSVVFTAGDYTWRLLLRHRHSYDHHDFGPAPLSRLCRRIGNSARRASGTATCQLATSFNQATRCTPTIARQ
jgi:hypothetical protein